MISFFAWRIRLAIWADSPIELSSYTLVLGWFLFPALGHSTGVEGAPIELSYISSKVSGREIFPPVLPGPPFRFTSLKLYLFSRQCFSRNILASFNNLLTFFRDREFPCPSTHDVSFAVISRLFWRSLDCPGKPCAPLKPFEHHAVFNVMFGLIFFTYT